MAVPLRNLGKTFILGSNDSTGILNSPEIPLAKLPGSEGFVCLFSYWLWEVQSKTDFGIVVAAWEGTWLNTEGAEYTKEKILILLQ